VATSFRGETVGVLELMRPLTILTPVGRASKTGATYLRSVDP
jgi:hypothetical protein